MQVPLNHALARFRSELGADTLSSAEIFKKATEVLDDDPGSALKALAMCHAAGFSREDVARILREKLVPRDLESSKARYRENVSLLRGHPSFAGRRFPEFEALHSHFLAVAGNDWIIYDRYAQAFVLEFRVDEDAPLLGVIEPAEVIMMVNVYDCPWLAKHERATFVNEPVPWKKTRLYLYYHAFEVFAEFLQVVDFADLVATGRIVFIFGAPELRQVLGDPQAVIPVKLIPNDPRVMEEASTIVRAKETEIFELQRIIAEHNDSLNIGEIINAIDEKRVRIAFSTSLFTTALQYYTRDCALACTSLGIPNTVIIEKSPLHRVTKTEYLRVMAEFKPHIVFAIDHYRWENPLEPDNAVFITWEQDNLPHMLSADSAAKIRRLDLIFNQQYDNMKSLIELGYPAGQMRAGPVPANHNLYKIYQLSDGERAQYSTDICYYANSGDSARGLEKLLEELTIVESIRTRVIDACRIAREVAKETALSEGRFLYGLAEYEALLSEVLKDEGVTLKSPYLAQLAKAFREEVGYRLMREVPLLWLHEKGYAMKLWGAEWPAHPVLGRYAMGTAQNGETLAKIINASKICLGLNPVVTCHPRLAETILSGGFYLALNLPREADLADVRRYLTEGEEIVFAYGREDFLAKVEYYLSNEVERRRICDNGRKKVLETLTFDIFMTRVLSEVRGYLASLAPGQG